MSRTPPVFSVVSNDTSVQALLGAPPLVRLFPFGHARPSPNGAMLYPYAVWQIVYGGPDNLLGDPPAGDRHGTQIDVYAKSWDSARAVRDAICDVIEDAQAAYVVTWDGESVEPATAQSTETYRVTFTVEWLTDR